jgi:hypothetical protein
MNLISTDQTDSLCSSPRLNDSDYALLDRAYWLANPPRLRLLMQRIFGNSDQPATQTKDKNKYHWTEDL